MGGRAQTLKLFAGNVISVHKPFELKNEFNRTKETICNTADRRVNTDNIIVDIEWVNCEMGLFAYVFRVVNGNLQRTVRQSERSGRNAANERQHHTGDCWYEHCSGKTILLLSSKPRPGVRPRRKYPPCRRFLSGVFSGVGLRALDVDVRVRPSGAGGRRLGVLTRTVGLFGFHCRTSREREATKSRRETTSRESANGDARTSGGEARRRHDARSL